MDSLMGQGREAINIIFDKDSLQENIVGGKELADKEYGPCAIVGTVKLLGETCTVIGNDAETYNPRFPVVYAGIIGMEEAYKMCNAVYDTIAADKDKPADAKRPIVLIVDTPGNGPGKQEEIFGMNKATGGYQLALAEARHQGHPIVAMVIGRAISGAFLCHGLQADHILALDSTFGTMIHVMPLTSIARITKIDIESLTTMSTTNPVFAAGPAFFYKLGGVEEQIDSISKMAEIIQKHIMEIRKLRKNGDVDSTGPWSRGDLGDQRGGRTMRKVVIDKMNAEFAGIEQKYIQA